MKFTAEEAREIYMGTKMKPRAGSPPLGAKENASLSPRNHCGVRVHLDSDGNVWWRGMAGWYQIDISGDIVVPD